MSCACLSLLISHTDVFNAVNGTIITYGQVYMFNSSFGLLIVWIYCFPWQWFVSYARSGDACLLLPFGALIAWLDSAVILNHAANGLWMSALMTFMFRNLMVVIWQKINSYQFKCNFCVYWLIIFLTFWFEWSL